MEYEQIEKEVEKTLSAKRFKHSQGVAKRAQELARIYGADEQVAKKVGIAHDIAKEMSRQDALQYLQENHIVLDEIEQQVMSLWHSKIGADICQKKFGFTDEEKQAVMYHTIGNVNMSLLDKIIYIADKTEEGRTSIDLETAKKICDTNLEEGLLYVSGISVTYSISKQSMVHPDTIFLMNEIIRNRRNQKEI